MGLERPLLNLDIRPARTTDAAAILRLHRGVLQERRYFITEPEEFRQSVDDKIRAVRELDRSPNSIFLVARTTSELVGFLTVRGGHLNRMRHTGKLEVMVAESARGKGVGGALLQAAFTWAEAHPDIEKIGLSVFADNTRAVELYRSFGFREEGRRTREYRLEDGRYVDDLLMYRFIGS
ncbi:MAG: GNAT family N-acetyltransferase [Deltaproteobacteria bacterium]|nr:MAG: GNAT family N-acetyltransferase [Deltaproteobacteria bacterium]